MTTRKFTTWSIDRIRRRLALFSLALILSLSAFYVLPATVSYHVTEHYLFAGGSEDQRVALAVIRPRSGPTQVIKNPYATHSGGNHWEPELGFVSEIVDVQRQIGQVKAQGQIQIEFHYTAVLRQGTPFWQQPLAQRFTEAQTNIESTHPAIVAEATSVSQGRSFDVAYALFSWVASTLSWPQGSRINTQPSALQALTSGIGGCAEFANLTTAFYRASKIPAYPVDGLAMPEMLPLSRKSSTWNHPAGAHAWVHFATDGQWTMADPSWAGRWLPFRYFTRDDARHLVFGEDAAVSAVYQELLAWGQSKGTVIGAMSAPLKFVAVAEDPSTTITPTVTVAKRWDGRYFNAILAGSLPFIALGLYQRRDGLHRWLPTLRRTAKQAALLLALHVLWLLASGYRLSPQSALALDRSFPQLKIVSSTPTYDGQVVMHTDDERQTVAVTRLHRWLGLFWLKQSSAVLPAAKPETPFSFTLIAHLNQEYRDQLMVGVATYSERIHQVAMGRHLQQLLGHEKLGIPADPRQPYTLTLEQLRAMPEMFQIATVTDGYALLVDNAPPLYPVIFAFDKDGQLVADSLYGERWLVAEDGDYRPAGIEAAKQRAFAELRSALQSGKPWTVLTVEPETAKDRVISPLYHARPVAAAVLGADQAEDATMVSAYIEHAAPGEAYYERDDLTYAVTERSGTTWQSVGSTRRAGSLQLSGVGNTLELRDNRNRTTQTIDLTSLLRRGSDTTEQCSIGSVALSNDCQMVAAGIKGVSPLLVVHDLQRKQSSWVSLAEGCRVGDLLFSEDGQQLLAILQTDWNSGSLDIYDIDRAPDEPIALRSRQALPGITAIRRLGPTMLTQAAISGAWSGLREDLYR